MALSCLMPGLTPCGHRSLSPPWRRRRPYPSPSPRAFHRRRRSELQRLSSPPKGSACVRERK
eukprot:6205048-Pleurochrysis_carterae.AAC.3